jgi:hypothetical protein
MKLSRLGSGDVVSIGRLRQSSWMRDMVMLLRVHFSWLRSHGLLRAQFFLIKKRFSLRRRKVDAEGLLTESREIA